MNLSILDSAKQKYLDGEESLATAFYERAVNEGIPNEIVAIRKTTKEYLLFPLDSIDAGEYFSLLFRLKELSRSTEYKDEYIKALNSLLNIKKMFLRELSVYYFSELAVCYGNSLIVKHIYELFSYIHEHLNDITESDCYEIRYNIPNTDMHKLRIDLLKVKAFCLNILLSYSAAQDSYYTGTTYNAYTYDYGWYSSTTVSSSKNYTTWAIIKPRLNMIGLEAYYDEYLTEYQSVVKEINKYVSFDSPKELRKELTDIVKYKYKKSKDPSDKEFYKVAKRLEKNDTSRKTFAKTMLNFSKYNPFFLPFKAFLEKTLGIGEIGSFELDTYFTRKKIWGVCDMISCARHHSVDDVRWFMGALSMFGIPIVLYIVLGIAMKFGFYLPGIKIEKH